MIEMAILGVLKDHEAHGYELKKQMASSLAGPAASRRLPLPRLYRLELAKRRRLSNTPRTDPYLRSLKERDITTLTDDLGWLDELTRITQEQLVPAVPKPVVTTTGDTQP